MKKAINGRLMNEVVDPKVCPGFTTDEVKAANRNTNLTKAAGSDKIHPSFLHYFRPVSISLLMSIFSISLAETKVSHEWRVADIRPIAKGERDLQKMETYIPHVDRRKNDGALGH